MSWNRLLEIIKHAQSRYPAFSQRLQEAEALGRWEQAVGPVIAKHTRAIRVQEGVLWVEVDHPIWKSELHHRKHQILALLNEGRKEENPKRASLAPAKDPLKDLFFIDPRPKGAQADATPPSQWIKKNAADKNKTAQTHQNLRKKEDFRGDPTT